MARFEVRGAFRFLDRGVVAYGDLAGGVVVPGDLLLIPLNGSFTSVAIRSVEAIDGTLTGAHIALVLDADSEEEVLLLNGLTRTGETLEIAPDPERDHAAERRFAEATSRLLQLLMSKQWPTRVAWVLESQVLQSHGEVVVFRPELGPEPERRARELFESFRSSAAAVRVAALGHADDMTVVMVVPIVQLGQGEEMFLHDGVKIDAPAEDPKVEVVRWRLAWWLARKSRRHA